MLVSLLFKLPSNCGCIRKKNFSSSKSKMSLFRSGRKTLSMISSSRPKLSSMNRKITIFKKNQADQKLLINPSTEINRLLESYERESDKTREILMAPYTYTRSLATVSIIPKIFEGFNHWMKIPDDKFGPIKDAMYLTYDAITMLDDLVDDSDLRRGYPTSVRIYGPERVWIATFSTVLIAIEKLLAVKQLEAVAGVCKNFLLMFEALAMLDHTKNYSGYPSEDEYFKIVFGKTCAVYSCFVSVMQVYSDCNVDFSKFIALLGLYTQVNNDNMNLSPGELINGKISAEDITCGIYTLPIILAVNKKNLDADAIFNIVRQKSKDSYMKDYCVDLIYKLGAMKDSRQIEEALYKEVMKEIESLGGNPILVETFNKLHSITFDETYFPNVSRNSKN